MTLSRRNLLGALPLLAGLSMPAFSASKTKPIRNLQDAIETATASDGRLDLPAGEIVASGIAIDRALTISGVAGRTRLISPDGRPVFIVASPEPVVLSGLTFSTSAQSGTDSILLMGRGAGHLNVVDCHFEGTPGSGVRLEGCAGRISNNSFTRIGKTALFARDSRGLEISGNTVIDIGNNGIQVWTSEPREDGSSIVNNRIARIRADDGGSGQNGNGINVYRAGNVTVSGNRISDCTFSAVRNNGGSNCQIISNSISRMGEVAIYCEFGFEGAVVSGNVIEDVALGVSITNFNDGGRLAVVANNVIRNVKGGGTLPNTNGVGIGAEADTSVTGNVIDDARDTGISLGWGRYSRNLMATGNLVRNCGRGIAFSAVTGADGVLISSNRISGARQGSIVGTDHGTPVTPDLGLPGADVPAGVKIEGNLVS